MISVITPALVKDTLGYQWLHECIASVYTQPGPWEHIVVNDHSPMNLDALKERWPHVIWLDAEGKGVSMARNQAADAAKFALLLPLDADDKLAPDALAVFAEAWENRGPAGIIYSDVVMFGSDYANVYMAAEYDFRTLLKATFMTVGCLHRKADWDRVGGWRLDMTQGLEDWEYWIALGELGVCGKKVAEPLYWYRRHPRGRLQWLKQNHDLWDRAYQAMRELHKDVYNGRFPMGCCGGSKPAAGARRPLHGGVPRSAAVKLPAPTAKEGAVLLAYYGNRAGDFIITGGVTRTKYKVPGRGGIVELAGSRQQGVNPADLKWFLSVNQGRDFRPVEAARPADPAPAPMPKPAPVPKPEPIRDEVWQPEIMEPVDAPGPVPDIQSMTVREIFEMDLEPDVALALLGQEEAGKGRKTVTDFLRRAAG